VDIQVAGADAAVGDAGGDRRFRVAGQADLDPSVGAIELDAPFGDAREIDFETAVGGARLELTLTPRAETPPLVVSAVMRPSRPLISIPPFTVVNFTSAPAGTRTRYS